MNTFLHLLTSTSRGGCESNAICLIRETPQYHHELLVLGPEGEMSAEFGAAGAVVEHRLPGRRSRGLIAAVSETVARVKPTGVLVWHGMVGLPEILHALQDYDGVILVHGGNPATSMPRWVDWRYRLREARLGRRAKATYVCCSQYVADSFVSSRYLRRFPRVVVPNGVRALTGPPHTPRPLDGATPLTIGMVARLDGIKDHPTLLRAFALVLRDYPAARLELAGDGERRGELEALVKELGLGQQVRFLGMIGEVYSALADWDLFAYATTEREGQGIALAEAMMAGLPCVVTNVGPIVEVAGDPAVLALVPDRDPEAFARATTALLGDLPRRKELSEKGRARALSEYSGSIFAARYAALILSKHHDGKEKR